jgi:hypothetical protein
MANTRETSHFDRARDELYSHVIRCAVLEASMEDRKAWMDDTIEYMAGRYPDLSDLEIVKLDQIGRRFIEPVIPHGAAANAANRDKWQEDPGVEKPRTDLVGAS